MSQFNRLDDDFIETGIVFMDTEREVNYGIWKLSRFSVSSWDIYTHRCALEMSRFVVGRIELNTPDRRRRRKIVNCKPNAERGERVGRQEKEKKKP